MELPKELFTPESILTLGGAALAVWLITNTVRYVFGWNPRWFGLVLAQAIAVGGGLSVAGWSMMHVLVAMANGFLIYATAVGTAAITAGAAQRPGIGLPSTASAGSAEAADVAVPTAALQPEQKHWIQPWF